MTRLISLFACAAVAALATMAASCGSPPVEGELMIAIETDMSLPKDIDRVRFEVLAYGAPKFDQSFVKLGDQESLKIPATLGILVGADPSTPITIRVTAWQGAIPRVLREAVTTVPAHRLAILRLPIQWLCYGSVQTQGTDVVSTDCAKGQTCITGACADAHIDSSKLPDYKSGDVFGGGSGKGDGSCFDVGACFTAGSSTAAMLDMSACTIAVTGDVNVAIQVESAGICGANGCFVPVNADSQFGWEPVNGSPSTLQLPKAICTKITDGTALGVVTSPVSASCKLKTDALPTCGPWSSSGNPPQTPPQSTLAAGQDHPVSLAVMGKNVYWTNAGTIGKATGTVKRTPVSGGAVDTLAGAQAVPRDLTVDPSGNVYWANGGTTKADGAIMYFDAAAGKASTFAMGQMAPEGVALHAGFVYWTAFGGGAVYGLAASKAQTMPMVLASGPVSPQNDPYRIAVDATTAYWTNEGGALHDGTVVRAPLSGGGIPAQVSTGKETPRGLVLDLDAGGTAVAVYWTNFAKGGDVMTAKISGGVAGAPVTVASGQEFPSGIALDGTYVYWTNRDAGTVSRVQKAMPFGVPAVIATAQFTPGAIAVDDANVYWINEGSSSVANGSLMRLTKPQ